MVFHKIVRNYQKLHQFARDSVFEIVQKIACTVVKEMKRDCIKFCRQIPWNCKKITKLHERINFLYSHFYFIYFRVKSLFFRFSKILLLVNFEIQ